MKYPRASGALRRAPDPMLKGSLHSHDTAAHCRQFRPVTIWPPPDQILDPPLKCFLLCSTMPQVEKLTSELSFDYLRYVTKSYVLSQNVRGSNEFEAIEREYSNFLHKLDCFDHN